MTNLEETIHVRKVQGKHTQLNSYIVDGISLTFGHFKYYKNDLYKMPIHINTYIYIHSCVFRVRSDWEDEKIATKRGINDSEKKKFLVRMLSLLQIMSVTDMIYNINQLL